MKNKIFLLMLLSILTACLTGMARSQVLGVNGNYYPEKEWRISTPEEQGMDSEILLDMFKNYGNQGRIIIIRNGYIVTHYNQSYLQKDIHHIHSCTKSIVSGLIGKAIDEGYIKNVNQSVFDFFPEYKKNEDLYEPKKKLTLYHLLTMSSGMRWTDSDRPTDSYKMSHTNNWAQYVFERPMIAEPGRVWNYNSGGSQLLSEIVQKVTGKSAQDYATEKIFKPLGMNSVDWWKDRQGHSTAGWGVHLTTFDITKIGYLFLREGRWEGKQVIPLKWVKESTKNYMTVESGFGRGFGYGYQWWVYKGLPYNAYKAWGTYGKHAVMIIVIPDLDTVVVLAGNNKKDRLLLKSYIIPSIKSSGSIAPNPEIVKELKNVIDDGG